MSNLLLVFTGGTIGSTTSGQRIDVDIKNSYVLIERYYDETNARRDVSFDTLQPFNRLSEDMLPGDWLELCLTIQMQPLQQYDGIVVTHGTDTLPYTAAALSYLLRALEIPVVMIASNYPLEDPRSKGVQNLCHAVDFIMDTKLRGVFVCFENDEGEALVHLGTRIRQSDPFTDHYESGYNVPFGCMRQRRFEPELHNVNPPLALLQSKPEKSDQLSLQQIFSSELLVISPYPGLDYSYLDFTQRKPRFVVHQLYHSGTASSRQSGLHNPHALQQFIRSCSRLDIAVYLSPVKMTAGGVYASASELHNAGAIPLPGMTFEAALVKLMLAYGNCKTHEEVQQWLIHHHDLFFEQMIYRT